MESMIRLGAALSIFIIMISWEWLSPRRSLSLKRSERWGINLGLAALNILIMRVSVGGIAFITAQYAQQYGLGLLNLFAPPYWISFVITLLFLDFAIYAQHILAHKWSFLWRFHKVHHTDLDFDATTAVRFHPIEIMLSMVYKVCCIFLIGAEPIAVIAFEIILNGAATFNHSNVYIPPKWDEKLRYFIITPDMHRIHHSTLLIETDSNYGFSISIWDRLFKTYTAKPKQSQTQMPIGLESFRNPKSLTFKDLLVLPFK